MAHVVPLTSGVFQSSPCVTAHIKSSEAYERVQQFVENERIDIGKHQRLRKDGNATIPKESAMTPGFGKIIVTA